MIILVFLSKTFYTQFTVKYVELKKKSGERNRTTILLFVAAIKTIANKWF